MQRLAKTAAAGVLSVSEQRALARTKGYPYARPSSSFLYAGTNVYLFNNKSWFSPAEIPAVQLQDGLSGAEVLKANNISPEMVNEKWTPILAIGSNAGPEQLARKFPVEWFPKGVLIPVVECVLEDFDVVYSPYFSSYGSCPATLEYSPGTAAGVFLTYLTPELAERMHATEAAYNLCELNNVRLHVGLSLSAFREGGAAQYILPQVYQYNHQLGSLNLPIMDPPGAHTPVAIAEIPALHRRFPALTQEDMQRALMWALEKGGNPTLAPVDLPLPDTTTDSAPLATPAPSSLPSFSATDSCTVPGDGVGAREGGERSWREEENLDEWILRNVEKDEVREKHVGRLAELAAKQFEYQDTRVVLSL